MKKYLRDLIAKKEKRAAELKEQIKTAETADEVRALGDTLDNVLEELRAAKEQLAKLDDDGNGDGDGEGEGGNTDGGNDDGNDDGQRANIPVNAQLRGSFKLGAAAKSKNEDMYDTEEYRTAFMNYVCRNVPIPPQYRATTTTGDAAAVIPTTILNEIIQRIDSYGNIFAKVRKLSIQGGISIPILSLKPEATWIGETTPSQDKKTQANTSITFSYFGLECKISQTLLANVTTLAMFQQLFVPLATEAMVKAIEKSIISGTGTNQPLGILNDTRIPAENIIEISDEDMATWGGWKKAVFAKMKKSYRKGEFIMNQATFDGYIDGMTDQTGQPIGRVNYGIDGAETYRFGGKNIETVDDFLLPSYEECAAGEAFAIFGMLTDYGWNSNMEMQTVKWTDHDTNEIKNKCILIADGKLIDPNGILIIKKASA
jgi:HK97 family phage major capsid protein